MVEGDPLWEFISLQEYEKPVYRFDQSIKTKMLRKFRKFIGIKSQDVFLTDLETLKEFPVQKLNRIVSLPDLKPAINQLDLALSNWLNSDPDYNNIVFLINPQRTYTSEILTNWASGAKFQKINNPNSEAILNKSVNWSKIINHKDFSNFFIPNLEKFYLRHFNGLETIRELFFFFNTNKLKVIIGVNSWSWVYLNKVLEIRSIGKMQLVLKPFDYLKLESWFLSLKKDSRFRKIVFRKANDGHFIINANSEDLNKSKDIRRVKVDYGILKNLSAYSEGRPKIAWTIWRYSLRIEPDDDFYQKNEDQEETEVSKKFLTTWVIPWERLKLPENVKDVARSELLILQSILLHDGLDENILEKILPLSKIEVLQSLLVLRSKNLIEKIDLEWTVVTTSYSFSKRLLANYGFFIDDF